MTTGRRSRRRPTGPVHLGGPRGRALPDGRSPRRTRPTRAPSDRSRSRTSSAGPGCATGRSTRSGSSRRRRYPDAGAGLAVNPALAGVALAITIGAIVAVSARDARIAILGLAVTPGRVAVPRRPAGRHPRRSRLAWSGPVLAAYLLGSPSGRPAPRRAGRGSAGPADALVAAAAAVVGYGTARPRCAGLGPAVAQAAGFALAALAVAPLVTGRDVLRVGIGLLLLIERRPPGPRRPRRHARRPRAARDRGPRRRARRRRRDPGRVGRPGRRRRLRARRQPGRPTPGLRRRPTPVPSTGGDAEPLFLAITFGAPARAPRPPPAGPASAVVGLVGLGAAIGRGPRARPERAGRRSAARSSRPPPTCASS